MLFYKVGILALCLLSLPSWALTPVKEFVKKQSFGTATNYRFEKADVDLTVQDTELSYNDLNQSNAKEISELIEVKKEYGKVFGFKEWTAENHKLLEEKSDRYFVVQGHYKDAENKLVNFIEIYWANSQKSGQFLLTSNSKKFQLENFREYLKQ